MNRLRYIAAIAAFAPMLGCSVDSSDPVGTTQAALTAAQVPVEDFGKNPGSFYSFDLEAGRAHATVLGLGMDIDLHYDGRVQLKPSLSVNAPRADWSYDMNAPKMGRGEVSALNEVIRIERDQDTLRLKHAGGVDVEWKHLPQGVEQFIRVFQRPEGTGDLVVAMNTPSEFVHKLADNGQSVSVAHNGEYIFGWSGLIVTDASGAKVPSSFRVVENGFEMHVDDRAAVYPILIDPIAGTPAWVVIGNQADARFGTAVSGVGDVNNDGYDDVLVGQSRYANGETREGRILLYNGSATGLPATASWTYESNVVLAQLGITVSGAGNVNNDNFDDFIAGAFFETNGGDAQAGAAYAFHGAMAGPGANADWKQFGDAAGAFFGVALSEAGDVNCDGYGDIIVGSSAYNSAGGKAWVYHGSATGLAATPAWTAVGSVTGAENFGSGVSGAGNLNGDQNGGNGCDDIVVGAPGYDEPSYTNQGRVYTYHGSSTGLGTTPAHEWSPLEANAEVGIALDGGGDFNNDGYDDIIVGAPKRLDTNLVEVGGFFTFHGSATGLSTPDLDVVGDPLHASSKLGNAIAVAGDNNNDGYDDIVVGAYLFSNGHANEGAVFELLGSPTGIIPTIAAVDEPDIVGAWFGYSVSGAGDFNGDGYDDVVVGARKYPDTNGNEVGAVFGYTGKPACFVDGDFYANGDPNPSNDCEVCDTATSTTAWSVRPDNSVCDDGSLCTTGDVCTAGVCAGTPTVVCNDGNDCTIDTCDPGTGFCDFDSDAADGDTCSIPNQPSCTTNQCAAGVCSPTAISGCLIGGACYQDGDTNPTNTCQSCNSALDQSDWSNLAGGSSCDDGLFCTVNDVCNGSGVCGGGARDCSGAADECHDNGACSESNGACVAVNPKPDGTACGGDLCTVAGMCTTGVCSGSTKDCSNLDTECTVGECNLADGLCGAQDRPNGTNCDDGDACTMATACVAGACAGGGVVDCDDGESCTTDSCDTTAGCMNDALPDNTTCDDGDACTENNVCTTGACGGTPLACDDGNECTANTCDMALGCEFANETDGTSCVGDGLSCTTGACMTGACDNSLNASVCLIDSTCYDDGVTNPGNSCQICSSTDATDDFSPADAGDACDLAECNVDGTAVLQGSCDGLGTCTTDAGEERDCGNYFCTDGACQTQCIADTECRDGFICEAGACADAECSMDDDCADGEVCREQRCESQCTTDEDCADGEACNEGVCEADGCFTDEDCEDGEVCNNPPPRRDPGVCEPAPCTSDDDCGEGQVCNADGVCEDEGGGDCSTNDDCSGDQICVEDQCVDPAQCSADADCASGEFCSEGVCVETPKGDLEGSGCGCASTGNAENADASWMLLALFGLAGMARRRRR